MKQNYSHFLEIRWRTLWLWPFPVIHTKPQRSLASMYDPLGVASPVTLVGKMVFRGACDRHLPWDAKESDMHQGLLAAKARLAKKGPTMASLELISSHMAANLVESVRSALEGCVVRCVYE